MESCFEWRQGGTLSNSVGDTVQITDEKYARIVLYRSILKRGGSSFWELYLNEAVWSNDCM